ncbi:MAG: DUF4358 domain-containing protein [Oscillospiraceae bacterium]|nr:DUF4358 domain-containing protein [Oscillospiraceae bacterium]
MRRTHIIIILLIASLAAAACNKAATIATPCSPTDIADAIITSQDSVSTMELLLPSDDYFQYYLSDIYMLDDGLVTDGAICYGIGMAANEVAVLVLNDASSVDTVRDALLRYMLRRADAFRGYAPEQAAMLENGKVATRGEYVALIVCEDTKSASDAFTACFSNKLPKISGSLAASALKALDRPDGGDEDNGAMASDSASGDELGGSAQNGGAEVDDSGQGAPSQRQGADGTDAPRPGAADANNSAAEGGLPGGDMGVDEKSDNGLEYGTDDPDFDDEFSEEYFNEAKANGEARLNELFNSQTGGGNGAGDSVDNSANNNAVDGGSGAIGSANGNSGSNSNANGNTANGNPGSNSPASDDTGGGTPGGSSPGSAAESGTSASAGGTPGSAAQEPAQSNNSGSGAGASDAYDPAAIRRAWRSGDYSSLSSMNRSILTACTEVIGSQTNSGMSDLEKETAINDWIVDWADYDHEANSNSPYANPDPNNSNPYGLLYSKKAICLGYTLTFQLFMDLLDIECITVRGTYQATGGEHAWNMVRIDGAWYCVDVTWNDPAGPNPALAAKHRYLNVTTDFMRETKHEWDESATPVANSGKLTLD